jgi:hypothetical protein
VSVNCHRAPLRTVKRTMKHTNFALLCVGLVCAEIGATEPVVVRHPEGVMHGFLVLQNLQGQTIADGETTQVARNGRVTGRLVFKFRDGSLYDDTVIFSQRGSFQLLSDHLIERGPSFPKPMDTLVDASIGQITVRYKEKDGKEKVITEKLDLPPDIANGMMLTLLKDIQPGVPETKVSMVAATPKPRIITLEISDAGEDPFSIGNTHRVATHYVVKVKIRGVAGIVAPVIGKQPPDTHFWILGGSAPTFVKSEGPLFEERPIWRVQAAPAPVFRNIPDRPSSAATNRPHR